MRDAGREVGGHTPRPFQRGRLDDAAGTPSAPTRKSVTPATHRTERLRSLDAQIAETFDQHPQAAVIQSMPGFGPLLGACLLVGAGDLRAFPSAGHLAAAAGLVPVPNDSGRRTGNLHRPQRYSRPLRHVFYLSAQTSMLRAGPNRDYYLKKREHGRTHSQAIIALARRRVDVLWALLRENRTWTTSPPVVAQAA